jgi:hypothetical protein
LPRSSEAELISGTSIGVDSMSSVVYMNGQVVGESSGSDLPEVLDVAFVDPLLFHAQMSIGDVEGNEGSLFGPAISYTLSPQNASASANLHGENSDLGGCFDVSYQSNLPDGSIDTSGGFAVADIGFESFEHNRSTYTIGFISFQGKAVPRPSSLLLAATASLMAVVFAWMRGGFSVSALLGGGRGPAW